jgi:signal transduction histidine kinase
VRLRLALFYGLLFLACGVVLLGVTYALVRGTSNATNIVAFPTPQGQAYALHAAASDQQTKDLNLLLFWSVIALAVMAVGSVGLGWVVAGRILGRLHDVTATARSISASNLHARLAFEGPNDELKELGDTFDELLGRLETSFEAQRQFVANASHELRTPLTVSRAMLQVALADPNLSLDSLVATCEEVLEAQSEQERLLEALLTLSQSQAGLEQREPLDLAPLTEKVLLVRQTEAQERGLELHANLAPAPSAGDPRLIGHLISNLVDNALRHNREHGRVEVVTEARADAATISVTNTGPLVPPDAVALLVEPFRRGGERTSSGDGHGLGLGLSIVRAIADVHGAVVNIEPKAEGGLEVTVIFKAREEQAIGWADVDSLQAKTLSK